MVEWYWLIVVMVFSSLISVVAIGLVSASGRSDLEAELFDKNNKIHEQKAQTGKLFKQLMKSREILRERENEIEMHLQELKYADKLYKKLEQEYQINIAKLQNKQTVIDVMREKYESKKMKVA